MWALATLQPAREKSVAQVKWLEAIAPLLGNSMALFTPEDLETIAADLPEGTAALVILFEHRWAVRIKDAMTAAGGFLVARETITPRPIPG